MDEQNIPIDIHAGKLLGKSLLDLSLIRNANFVVTRLADHSKTC